jgi:DNA gyrase subunit A
MSKVVRKEASNLLKDAYLKYSMAVITDRALPDVRDGLKPVHRRILYAAKELGLSYRTPYKKSARLIGDTMGKYHPHGDCLGPDTKVLLTSGVIKTIKELYEDNIDVEILAYDPKSNNIIPSIAHSFRIGQETDKIIKITLSDGSIIEATDNHPFYVLQNNSGSWVQVKNLKEGMVLSSFEIGDVESRPFLRSFNFQKQKIEEMVKLHLLSTKNLKNSGMAIHHKNEDTTNNSFSNIDILSVKEHNLTHHPLEERLKTLKSGRDTMFSGEKWFRDFIAFKNSYVRKKVNEKMQLIKAINVLKKLKDSGCSIDHEKEYCKQRISLGYNTSSISKLIELGLINEYKDILEYIYTDKKVINYDKSEVIDLFISEYPNYIEYKNDLLNKSTPDIVKASKLDLDEKKHTKRYQKFVKIVSLILEKEGNIDISWDMYEKYYKTHSNGNYNKIKKYSGSEFWSIYFDKPIDLIKELSGYFTFITKIETVIKSKKEPMYDFTVDGLENMLIMTSNNTLVVAHNSSIYDAMVNLAQPFSMNMPIIDGQGNFGSIDGDNAAAHRYTEARLTRIGAEFLTDIEKDSVTFIPNYDDSLTEPEVLPTRIPNLLLNGSIGIAVGMATSIPPHNLKELMAGLIHIVKDKPKLDDSSKLYSIIKGPDFPTGGSIFGKTGIDSYFKEGKGGVKIAAKWHEEKVDNRNAIIIDEIPYQINKAKLIIQIDELAKNQVVEDMHSISDESNKEGIRIVITLKQGANPKVVMNKLYKNSNLLVTFSCNLLAIVKNEPKVLNIRDILEHYITHRKTVIIRKTIFELNKINGRIHILEGLLLAIDKIDETINIIKSSKSTEESHTKVSKLLGTSKIQTQAILDLRLQRLSGFELDKINNELTELNLVKKELNLLLSDQNKLDKYLLDEFKEISEKYGVNRKTDIVDEEISYKETDFIDNEPIYIVKSNSHYITTVKVDSIHKQKRGGVGKSLMKLHSDDFISDVIEANLHDNIMLITNLGRAYRLPAYKLPSNESGKALVNLLDLQEGEEIVNILKSSEEDELVVFTTKSGQVIKMRAELLVKIKGVKGASVIKLKGDDRVITTSLIKDSKDMVVSLVTKEGSIVRFSLDLIREIRNRGGSGVIGMRMKDGNYLRGNIIRKIDEEYNLLSITENGFIKKTAISEYGIRAYRGGKGIKVANIDKKTGLIVNILDEDCKYDLVIITKLGKIIKLDTSNINPVGRVSKGVKGIKLVDNDKVVSVIKSFKVDLIEKEGDE